MKISVLKILILSLLLAACARPGDKPGRSHERFAIAKDGTATVGGPVAANKSLCVTGDACYLTLALSAREVHVIYKYAGGGCQNNDAGKSAAAVKPGQRISAGGAYARDGAAGVIDLCAGHGSYLTVDAP